MVRRLVLKGGAWRHAFPINNQTMCGSIHINCCGACSQDGLRDLNVMRGGVAYCPQDWPSEILSVMVSIAINLLDNKFAIAPWFYYF